MLDTWVQSLGWKDPLEKGKATHSSILTWIIVYRITYLYSESESHVQLFATPYTIQSMEFSRPEYWSGYPFPSPQDLPSLGIKPKSPALQADSLPTELQGKS